MNVVPKTGGNRISGSVFFSGTNEILQSDNFTDEIRAAGLARRRRSRRSTTSTAPFGGPIKQDRDLVLRQRPHPGQQAQQREPVVYNLNAGDATKWLYARTRAGPASRTGRGRTSAAASPGRPTPRTRSAASGTSRRPAGRAKARRRASPTRPALSPEAGSVGATKPLRVMQASWTRRSPTACCSMPASAASTTVGAASSATRTRPAISPASRNSARPAAPPTAASRSSSTGRRTSTSTTPARSRGRPTSPTSPAPTA